MILKVILFLQVQEGLKRGQLIQGKIRINPKNFEDAYVPHPDGKSDIYLGGLCTRNRALEGDVVVIQLNPREEWKVLMDEVEYCANSLAENLKGLRVGASEFEDVKESDTCTPEEKSRSQGNDTHGKRKKDDSGLSSKDDSKPCDKDDSETSVKDDSKMSSIDDSATCATIDSEMSMKWIQRLPQKMIRRHAQQLTQRCLKKMILSCPQKMIPQIVTQRCL